MELIDGIPNRNRTVNDVSMTSGWELQHLFLNYFFREKIGKFYAYDILPILNQVTIFEQRQIQHN